MRLNRFWLIALVGLMSFGVATSFQVSAANADTKTAKTSNAPAKTTTKVEVKKTAKSSKKSKAVRTTVTRSSEPAVAARPSFATALGLRGQNDDLSLKSSVAMVVNQDTKEVYFEKNSSVSLPIASITKLMTAMVVLDSKLPLDETLVINADDVHIYRSSRLSGGTVLTREEALLLALMSSENRAAHALGRNYPGGISAFVAAMNRKAQELGMTNSRFLDPTGLNSSNVSTARDLAKMVGAAYKYPAIREASTTSDARMDVLGRMLEYRNTNPLVRTDGWEIGVSKTGYIREAGKCLVMQAKVNNRPMLFVLLDSEGSMTRVGDANRLKKWAEAQS